MYIPGDVLNIQINMGDLIYDSNLVISYIFKDKIITCGHCLPKNAILDFGDIIYTTGFDNPNEKYEIGLIKIKPNKINSFLNKINDIELRLFNFKLNDDFPVYNYYNRNKIFGKLIINNINEWKIDHQITKLSKPYYFVAGIKFVEDKKQSNYIKKKFKLNITDNKIAKLTKSGYSGSPWILEKKNKLYHIGIHIGKTIGIYENKIYEIAYIKPIK